MKQNQKEFSIKRTHEIRLVFRNGQWVKDSQDLSSLGIIIQSSPSSLHVDINLAEGSQLILIEDYQGEGSYKTEVITQVSLGENASLNLIKLQEESLKSSHTSVTKVSQKRGSRFHSQLISLGGLSVKNRIESELAAEGAEVLLDGLFLAHGKQQINLETWIDHAKPHASSQELYKGILDGQSHSIFNGTIVVRPGAQKTTALQMNKNLLLSKEAVIDTKPQLEIDANDVQCRHGATVGQLDPEAIFYLRSRGLSENKARSLLTNAFANEMVQRIKNDSLRLYLEERVHSCLSGKKEAGHERI
ncbi:MAG: Fe-S cluster assembly protein SufD [bacterium]|nr:Fe-S cluster assembly protein SufD [bacterium]